MRWKDVIPRGVGSVANRLEQRTSAVPAQALDLGIERLRSRFIVQIGATTAQHGPVGGTSSHSLQEPC